VLSFKKTSIKSLFASQNEFRSKNFLPVQKNFENFFGENEMADYLCVPFLKTERKKRKFLSRRAFNKSSLTY